MAIITIESYPAPSTVRAARRLLDAGSRAAEELAGRTVWCAAAFPAGRPAAQALNECLLWARESGVASRPLELRPPGELVSEDVQPDDVVVVHDPFTAALARAIRERGAHVVWRMDLGAAHGAGEAWSFLRPLTAAVDAYLAMWAAPEHGTHVERIVAMMPSADAVATRDVAPGPAAERRHDLGWSSALAAAVAGDRAETVGGTRHARPATPAR